MRIKLINNKDKTFHYYFHGDFSNKKFIVKNGSLSECENIKKQIDKHRRDNNAMNRLNGGNN